MKKSSIEVPINRISKVALREKRHLITYRNVQRDSYSTVIKFRRKSNLHHNRFQKVTFYLSKTRAMYNYF